MLNIRLAAVTVQRPLDNVLKISVRHKKWGPAIIPHRKPRWIPMARSKMFVDPPTCLIPKAELVHEQSLHVEYRRRMKALTQYLYEDEAKFSDAGEAGRLEALEEERQHTQLLQENEEYNKQVMERRNLRLQQEMEDIKITIEAQLQAKEEEERERLVLADAYVRREAVLINKRIEPQALEEAIIKALDSPMDPEFALDRDGHIYRGRATKSMKVPKDNREKLPARGSREPENVALQSAN